MKPKHIFFIFALLFIFLNAEAQIKIPSYSRSKKVESEIRKHSKKDKDKKEEKKKDQQTTENKQTVSQQTEVTDEKPQLVWSKYDFVPGENIIFEDDLADEENGEFPMRWDLMRGTVEVAEFGGENVIMFRDGAPTIIPYMVNATADYLPDVFTIEFDLYVGTDNFTVYLYDRKNQESGSPTGYTYFNINYYRMEFGKSSSRHPDENTLDKRRWVHVAIAYNHGKLKAYMDDTRLINIPRIDFDPQGLSFNSYHCRNDNLYYVKNIRIAEGGTKYYDRIMEDGKIVATGIRFDSGKATMKPESMGIINEMVEMMEKYPDMSISIEGHTDSDGAEDANQVLSEERALTVMNTMTELGISPDRLKTKGFGESVPVADNSTAEGKANNRRVEFVKL